MAKKKPDRRELFKVLKKGNVAPLYYLHGPDAFMLGTAVEAITKAALPGGTNEFNFQRFRGGDTSAEAVRGAAETLPFLSERRVVILSDAQEMATSELDALADYFENPAPSTCLVVVAMTADKKLDGRTRPVAALRKHGDEFEFTELRDYEVGDVVQRNARSHGIDLDADAAAHLVEALGTDMSALMSALEKIDLYLGPDNRRATIDDVRAVVADTRVRSVFELTDALGARDLGAAMRILSGMMESGESAIRILAMVARHFRIVGKLQDDAVTRGADRETARAVGVSPYFLRNYKADARRFTPAEIAMLRRRIVETDFALKSSRLSDRAIVEALVLDVCNRQSP